MYDIFTYRTLKEHGRRDSRRNARHKSRHRDRPARRARQRGRRRLLRRGDQARLRPHGPPVRGLGTRARAAGLPARPETVAAYLADRADQGRASPPSAPTRPGSPPPTGPPATTPRPPQRASAPPCAASPASGQATGAARHKRSPTTRSQRSARQPASPGGAGAAHSKSRPTQRSEGRSTSASARWPQTRACAEPSSPSSPGRTSRHGRTARARLSVRRSKTDQEGEGAVVYLSPQTMRELEAIRPNGQDGTEPVFALGPAQLSRRIAAAARAAGLGERLPAATPAGSASRGA